jgi:hypothetical protein
MSVTPRNHAKAALRETRQITNWSRLLPRPMRMNDGTVLFTLKDAAERILSVPASASSRAAAEQIIKAALHDGDIAIAQATIKLALFKLMADSTPSSPASIAHKPAREIQSGSKTGSPFGERR